MSSRIGPEEHRRPVVGSASAASAQQGQGPAQQGTARQVAGRNGQEAPAPVGAEAVQGIRRLEGYLLFASRREEARRGADRLADQLPWLTSGQREDLTRVYVRDRMALYRDVNASLVERAAELRAEYTERYRLLRRRCVAAAAGAVVVAMVVAAALTLLLQALDGGAGGGGAAGAGSG